MNLACRKVDAAVVCLSRLAVEATRPMAYSLDQIDWCNVPLVPAVPDPGWERESSGASASHRTLAKYLTPVRWLMEAEQLGGGSRDSQVSRCPCELSSGMVVAMDSSCRHCYGAFRSMLKILGYPEALIRELEESLATNQLTNKEQAALEFARKISRSAPRPSESDLRELTAGEAIRNSRSPRSPILPASMPAETGWRRCSPCRPSPLEEIDANWFDKLKRPFTRKEFRAALSSVCQRALSC